MTRIKTGEGVFEAAYLSDCIDWLTSHKVQHIDLKWTWNRTIELDVPRHWPFTDEGQYKAKYIGRTIDNEYSYIGAYEPEAFYEFASNYGCWDDAELAVVDGTLVGSMDEYDPDADSFPDDEDMINVAEWDEIGLVGYEYWDEKAAKWRLLP